MGIGGYYPRGKAVRSEVDNSSPSGKVRIAWSYISTPPYVFMAWCLIKHRIHLHVVVVS
jgi:hypothetical protein